MPKTKPEAFGYRRLVMREKYRRDYGLAAGSSHCLTISPRGSCIPFKPLRCAASRTAGVSTWEVMPPPAPGSLRLRTVPASLWTRGFTPGFSQTSSRLLHPGLRVYSAAPAPFPPFERRAVQAPGSCGKSAPLRLF